MSSTTKTIVLITGANTGLGLEIVKSLCRSSHAYHVLIGCRSTTKGDTALAEVKQEYPHTLSSVEVIQTDLSSDSSLQKAIDTITTAHGRLDVLVNNGGADFGTAIQSGKLGLREGWLASWDTNVAGTHVLTTYTIPLLLKSQNPRLIFMASGTSTLTETESQATQVLKQINGSPVAGWPKPQEINPITVYRASKTGLNMLMREWHRILGNDGVKVWCVSPGFLATGLSGIDVETLKQRGAIEPSEGGNFVVSVVEGERDQDVGKVIRKNMIQPW